MDDNNQAVINSKLQQSEDRPVLKFTLALERQDIELQDLETGEVKRYYLREMDGLERDKYLNNMSARFKVGPDGKTRFLKDFTGWQANLVSRCLHTSSGDRVTEKEVEKFPARVQQALFKAAQELCGLDEEAEEAAKND